MILNMRGGRRRTTFNLIQFLMLLWVCGAAGDDPVEEASRTLRVSNHCEWPCEVFYLEENRVTHRQSLGVVEPNGVMDYHTFDGHTFGIGAPSVEWDGESKTLTVTKPAVLYGKTPSSIEKGGFPALRKRLSTWSPTEARIA